MSDDFDYNRWYPEVPPVLDVKQLAELLNTNDQITRQWAREEVIPSHRRDGGRAIRCGVPNIRRGSSPTILVVAVRSGFLTGQSRCEKRAVRRRVAWMLVSK